MLLLAIKHEVITSQGNSGTLAAYIAALFLPKILVRY